MTIAALLNADPRPQNSGSRIRDGVFVDELRKLDTVDVFAFDTTPPDDHHHLREHRPFPAAAVRAVRRDRMIMQERYDFSLHEPLLTKRVAAASAVHAAELYAGTWVTESSVDTPLIWSSHDQDRAVWEQRGAAGPRSMRPAYGREARRAERSVRAVLERAELVVPTTEDDAQVLNDYGATGRIEVIANGAWFDRWDSCASRGPEGEDIVIFGSMGQKVTAAGMEWFLDQVLPLLHRRRRGISIRVIGRSGTSRLEDRMRAVPGLKRHADVESIPDAVAGSAVIAVPQVRGTGSKLKTFETMAAGLPVVCTEAAVVGVDWLPREFAVESTATAFADALLARLEDPGSPSVDRDEARRRFDWNSLGAAYRQAVVETIGITAGATS